MLLHDFLVHVGPSSSDITIISSSSSPDATTSFVLGVASRRPGTGGAYLLWQKGYLLLLENPQVASMCSDVIPEASVTSVPTQPYGEEPKLSLWRRSPAARPLEDGDTRLLRFGGIRYSENRIEDDERKMKRYFACVAFKTKSVL